MKICKNNDQQLITRFGPWDLGNNCLCSKLEINPENNDTDARYTEMNNENRKNTR